MKSKSFFLTLVALLVASFGLAFAGSITIDHVVNSWDDGGTPRIQPNLPIEFHMRFTNNNGAAVEGLANAFKVYIQGASPSIPDPTGAFTAATIDTMPHDPPWVGYPFNTVMFDQGFSLSSFSADGVGADTIGINGLKSAGFGLYDGFDAIAVVIYTGGVAVDETFCLDTSFAPPTAYWMWAPPGEGDPVWTGPYCYLAKVPPNFPPTITNCPSPTETHLDHCVGASYTFTATDVESDNITFEKVSGPGTVTAAGVWSFAPTIVDAEVSTALVVKACDDFAPDHCGANCTYNIWFDNDAPAFVDGCESYNVNNNSITPFPLVADDDCDALTYSVVSITPTGGSQPLIGTINFVPGTSTLLVTTDTDDDGSYDVVVQVSDTKATGQCTVTINVIPGSLYQVVIGEVGDQNEDKDGGFVYQGQHVMVPVMLEAAADNIGGYHMLIAYDASALSFQAAYLGADFGPLGCGWEYFTYRFGPDGNCGNACPSGLLTVTAIAETNDGPLHPDCFLPDPIPTVLFNLDFLVTNDYTFECSFIPIRFFWMSCVDNALSSELGDIMLISDAVYDGYDPEAANGKMNIYNPLYGMYPTYFGAQDFDCFDPEERTKAPTRAVSFENGGVWIACVDSIDDRGDINLNSVPYEIADAVLYSNYFIYGLGVFTVNTPGQIAASDVNADGLTLSVADLVYLIRVVVGDALPYAKIAPAAINFTVASGMINVESALGAAYVVVEGDATPILLVDNMEMRYAYDASINATRVLVYSMEEGATFEGTFLNANGTVVSAEFATYEGAPVTAKLVPTAYSLSQNYPNPFNPTTSIAFDLPQTSDYSLRVFNVTGQKVAEFAGSAEAGTVVIEWDAQDQASGIYFYKLTAGNFTATKKMVLLK